MHILCLEDQTQIIYPDFSCRSTSPPDLRSSIIGGYLTYLIFDDFTVRLDADNPYQINLKPIQKVTDTLNDSHIAEIKAAVESLGVSPDLFTYQLVQ